MVEGLPSRATGDANRKAGEIVCKDGIGCRAALDGFARQSIVKLLSMLSDMILVKWQSVSKNGNPHFRLLILDNSVFLLETYLEDEQHIGAIPS